MNRFFAGFWLLMGLSCAVLAALLFHSAAQSDGSNGSSLAVIFMAAAAISGAIALVHVRAARADRRAQASHDRLVREGTPATMRIVDVRDTGATEDNDPMVTLRAEIGLPDGVTYVTSFTTRAPRLHLHRLSAGQPFKVRVDPEQRDAIFIDWDAP